MGFSRQEYWSGLPFPSPVDHICQTSPPWPARLGWPHTAWLSFIELDQAVVRVIRFASFLWVWFQCVCPVMPSHNTYRLTWVSLTLDLGYLFMAAPAKCSHCSLSWTRGVSSRPPLLTWKWSSSSWPSCACAATTPWSKSVCTPRGGGWAQGVVPKLRFLKSPVTGRKSTLGCFIGRCNWRLRKNVQFESCELSFIWRKIRTAAREAAS